MNLCEHYNLNSGVALYFSNSTIHSLCVRGGRIPVIGLHSVILSPDSVNRVTPPTTMTPNTKTEDSMSHLLTDGGGRMGSSVGFDWVKTGRLKCKERRRHDGRREGKTLEGLLVVPGETLNAVCKDENWPRKACRYFNRRPGAECRYAAALSAYSIVSVSKNRPQYLSVALASHSTQCLRSPDVYFPPPMLPGHFHYRF